MNTKPRLPFQPIVFGLILAAGASQNFLFAEGRLVPEQSRIWTHQDGRTAELRYVTSVGEKAMFADVDLKRVYYIAKKDLSTPDQKFLGELFNDGSRMWTSNDGVSRRMRFVEIVADKAVFDVPNVGRQSTSIDNLVPKDRVLVRELASSKDLRFGRYLVRTQGDQLTGPRGDSNPKSTLDATKDAFQKGELMQDLNAIGSDARFSTGDSDSSVKVEFSALKVSIAEANRSLVVLAEKAKPQVVQILGLREKEAKDFGFSLVLATRDSGSQPGSSGTNVLGITLPLAAPLEQSEINGGSCFSDCSVYTPACGSLTECQPYNCEATSTAICSSAVEIVNEGCDCVWDASDRPRGCGTLLSRLRLGRSE